MLTTLYRLLDTVVILISSGIAHVIKFDNLTILNRYYLFTIILLFLTINVFSFMSVYSSWRGKTLPPELTRITAAWVFVILIISTITFITKTGQDFSRAWIISTYLIAYIGFISYRICLKVIFQKLQKIGYNQKRVVIIGAGNLGQKACKAMQDQTWAGLIPIAFFDDNHSDEFNNVKVLGTTIEAIKFIEKERTKNPIDQIWITLPLSAQNQIEKLQTALLDTATKVYFVPDLFGFNLASYKVDEIIDLPIMNMSAPKIDVWSIVLKRIEDLIISSISLILLIPFFLIISALIKLDSKGPIFFKQRRYGLDGIEILVWKFRSMTVTENNDIIEQAKRNDSRVTKFGAFLRKTSIDELPQLINVISGTMSLVGPRPHAVAHNEFYRKKVKGYMVRHQMKPGITGWAQINGSRGETAEIKDMEKRIRLDLEYINKWSLFLDIQIILKTFATLTDNKNTY